MMQDWADFLEETSRTGEFKLIPPSYKIEFERKPDDNDRTETRKND
jgi:hypothetical protein